MIAADRFDAEALLAGILDWVRIESPTIDPAGVNRAMDAAEADMRALGAAIERLPGMEGFGDVLKASVPGLANGPGILVLGHLDTVHPVGTLAGPLPIRREGDKAYGPGIVDMKGGMRLAVFALADVLRRHGRPPLPVTFLFIPDEEVGSPGTRALIEGEARRHKHILVPEPSRGGKVVTGRHAFQRWHVSTHGRPAHAGGNNRDGKSAIRVMARLIEEIEAGSDFDRGVSYAVGIVNGGVFVNVVPMECRAQVLCVAPTDAAFAEVEARMLAMAGEREGVRIDVTRGPVRPLFKPNPGTLALYEVARGIAADLGFALEHGQFGGGSDGNFTGALGLPTLDGLGVVGAGVHTHDEHLLVPELPARAALLAGLLERLD